MTSFLVSEGRTSAGRCVTIAVCSALCFAGCFNAFPLKTDTGTAEETDTLTDTETLIDTDTIIDTDSGKETAPIDTSTGSGSASDTRYSSDTTKDTSTGTEPRNDTESESETPCPEGIELASPIQYTAISSGDIDATEYIDTCPSGQIIVGFEGFLQEPDVDPMVHGRIRAICGAPSVRSVGDNCTVEITPADRLPLRGIAGTLEWSQTCPANEVIMGFNARTGHNIDCLVFRCVPLVIVKDGHGYMIEFGAHRDMEPVGNTEGGSLDFQHDCPDGQVATTTKLKADHFLRSFALGCQTPSLTN